MNIFRLAGDLSHLLAIIILLLKIWKTRSCAGISGRSQILFALVYTTRYLDLVSNFVSIYNSAMKVFFIGASLATLCLMYIKFKATYDRNHDTFRIEFLIIPAAVLAFVVNHDFSRLEVLWTFSIYLESVAILPQFFLVSKTGEAETMISHYLFCLGSYKGLYILNWVYRYYSEGFYDLIAIIAGVVQTLLYLYFFYLYITKGLDAAGMYFYNAPPELKLDTSDANFVVVIITNGGTNFKEGIGTLEPLGHVNIYPNGGKVQPVCFNSSKELKDFDFNRNLCSHYRSVFLFATSIMNEHCRFTGIPCEDYDSFPSGKCNEHFWWRSLFDHSPHSKTAEMGFNDEKPHSLSYSPIGLKYYLKTSANNHSVLQMSDIHFQDALENTKSSS